MWGKEGNFFVSDTGVATVSETKTNKCKIMNFQLYGTGCHALDIVYGEKEGRVCQFLSTETLTVLPFPGVAASHLGHL